MTSSLNKNIFLNKERSISLSYAPKESLLNSFKMSDKKYILKNNEIKRYTSDNKINKNENIKISYKKLFEKKKSISRNNKDFKFHNSSMENENTFPSTIKNNDSNFYLHSDSKKHTFFQPIQTTYKKYSIFSKKIKIDLKKSCIKNVIERNKMDMKNYTFDEIKKKVLKNYTPELAKNEFSVNTNEPTDVQTIDNNNNTFYRNEKSLNTYASPTQNRRNYDLKFKSNKEIINLKKIGKKIIYTNKKRYSIDLTKFPIINLDEYYFRKEVRKKGKLKANKELKAISNLMTEYEELNEDKGSYSKKNLNRIVDLLRLKEFEFNEFEMNNPKDVKRDKITPETEEGCYILTAISRLGPPPFLKTKFKSKTIFKYNDSMGFGFGSTRNKNGNIIREKVHTLKYKVE
jgi:hypothetical protein